MRSGWQRAVHTAFFILLATFPTQSVVNAEKTWLSERKIRHSNGSAMGQPCNEANAQSPVLLICDFFPSGEEFQAASGISSRTLDCKAVSKAPTAFRPVSVSW